MYGDTHDIPSSDEMGLYKFKDAGVMSDACNAARSASEKIVHKIEEAIEFVATVEGVEHDPSGLQMNCHHHLRNIWLKALNKYLSKYLNIIFEMDLKAAGFSY